LGLLLWFWFPTLMDLTAARFLAARAAKSSFSSSSFLDLMRGSGLTALPVLNLLEAV
jgi:hypothetical protein